MKIYSLSLTTHVLKLTSYTDIGMFEHIIFQVMRISQNKEVFILHRFLSKRHFACENNTRLGNALDGGWDICLAEPYRPKPPCLVYSFGQVYGIIILEALTECHMHT